MLIIFIVIGIIAIVLIGNRSKYLLHMMQLEGYNSEQFEKWINNNKKKAFSWKNNTGDTKKPLVFTNRAKRLYTANLVANSIFILYFIFKVSILRELSNLFIALNSIILVILIGILYYLQPLMFLAVNKIISPMERKINMKFYEEAQERIKNRKDLNIVGITGSFGKTSTKFILGTILGEKFKVLNTPESYNTPMGLSKVINNDLTEEHEVFIAELGARNIGDIKEVSELVQPKIGVLTSIGPTHMETFKNIDNIMKTKYELIEELPPDGVAIFNYDNEHIKKLADKTFKEKILYGFENIEQLDLYAEDIEVSELGSTFTVKDKDGNSIRCTTKLLGKHNIYNVLAGVAVGKVLGLSFEEIKEGIRKIEPIPHRLNIMNPGTGIIIIDDAFNSNPIGAKAALEVLSQFKEGRKIIVTPGMVELGAMEKAANKEFGINIGKVCDYVILVGQSRTKPIFEGLMEVNYSKDNIFIVNTLDEATGYIQKIARPKDIVLFENDLPDNYSE
ncbi:UDP-N-acetylmuramoyl-tripeptide--D-alanyl-D-alanine ligase [Tissierella pigra]|uniref:UDP-N-acetylmuramoyl-tripeptide--D-alanyl-D-alanine ligase n=1 Tax=Tissierella pigra TaxID=2607614 RepID=A0A6N7XWR7_9FIRM|nr:UDP-N-acetylmuramoyl-tripeptide--D-alanyl-D-alanine ligase [Tissierella pigra]MBU5425928.1 UDP-N-acetylmuramoyl-tripeptide--D-alanyl-D-alanine ligase [Tissierella pigra]MSU00708.1 UDP-N-acetylmuramoyl-tripeptide--D-alanyl-D-alanine ligase [Tissierella pigra]